MREVGKVAIGGGQQGWRVQRIGGWGWLYPGGLQVRTKDREHIPRFFSL